MTPTKLQWWLDLIALLVARRLPVTVEDLTEGRETWVRYSPRIARWIGERYGGCPPKAEWSAQVRHVVAYDRWTVTHVTRYGGAAAVEART